MPELPEVETVRRTIEPHVLGRAILHVEVSERRLRRPISPAFASQLVGARIVAVRRRAKYLLFDLASGIHWVVHLGMSGRLCVGTPPQGMSHVHVIVRLEGGTSLYYRDPRRFGLMLAVRGERELGVIGLEPLEGEFTAEAFWRATRRRSRTTVKSLLMDQTEIAGVGNIYANEALFEAGVRPSRRCGRVTRADAGRIVARLRAVLERSIASRGSSLLDYRDADGNQGEFQRTLSVYEREGEACRRCGASVRRTITAGRSSFYCPRCQR